jgi:hypothetical protein
MTSPSDSTSRIDAVLRSPEDAWRYRMLRDLVGPYAELEDGFLEPLVKALARMPLPERVRAERLLDQGSHVLRIALAEYLRRRQSYNRFREVLGLDRGPEDAA